MVPGAALLIAAACAFSPTAQLAPLSVDRVRPSPPAAVMMAGWQDNYSSRNPTKTVKMKKTKFEEEMAEVDRQNNQKLVIGSVITVAGIGAIVAYNLAMSM